MGKKVYSQEEFNQLMRDKMIELRGIYVQNKDLLSNKEIQEILNGYAVDFDDPGFEPEDPDQLNENRALFMGKFAGTALDIPPFEIAISDFIDKFNYNSNYRFVYIYFVSSISIGFRFSNTPGLEYDLDTEYGDNFFILNNKILDNVSKESFKQEVEQFHETYDDLITNNNVSPTLHIQDLMSDALNIVNRNPQSIEMFFVLDNDKLAIGTFAMIAGSNETFNRAKQWP